MSAACITFDRPNAKSKSSPERTSTTGIVDIASPRRLRNAPASFRRPSAPASCAWMSAATDPSAIAASTLANPAVTAPALLASASAWRRSARSAASISWGSVGDGLTSADLKARLNKRRRTASSTMAPVAVTQTPRPGSRRFRSGTTAPSGPSTKRIISAGERIVRVTMQVRSGSWRGMASPRPPLPACGERWFRTRRMRFGFQLFLGAFRLDRRLDPARLDARGHNYRLGVGARESELVQDALVAHRLGTLAVRPAHEVVGGAAGEVLDGLDIVLAERDQHRGRDAVDFPHVVGDAQFLPPRLLLGLDAGEIVLGSGLDLGGRVLVEALDRREFGRVHVGQFLNGAEALRGQKLAHDLVHV